jgi:hypothetical protein
VAFAVVEGFADLHKEDSAFFTGDPIFTFLRCAVRIHVKKLLSCDKEDILWKDLLDVVILYSHVFLGFTKDTVNGAYGFLENFNGTLFFGDDLFPVPLVYVNGVDIVQIFIPADCYHICVKTLSVRKSVFFQCVAFPFGKGVYDLGVASFDRFDIKTYRAFYTIKVVIKAGFRGYKCRGGYSEKVQLL